MRLNGVFYYPVDWPALFFVHFSAVRRFRIFASYTLVSLSCACVSVDASEKRLPDDDFSGNNNKRKRRSRSNRFRISDPGRTLIRCCENQFRGTVVFIQRDPLDAYVFHLSYDTWTITRRRRSPHPVAKCRENIFGHRVRRRAPERTLLFISLVRE